MKIAKLLRDRQIQLGTSIVGRRKVYLDMRFWIILRDASLGVNRDPWVQELLHQLRRGVAVGKLICPISASTFLELMKQPNSPGRRAGTAELIDELSLGISIVSPAKVMEIEIHRLFLQAKGHTDLYSIQQLIWTKVVNTLGDVSLLVPDILYGEQISGAGLFDQENCFDVLWNMSLSQFLATMGTRVLPTIDFAEVSLETNLKNAQFQHELRSFEQTIDTELRGISEIAGDLAADVIQYLSEKEPGATRDIWPEARAELVRQCRNLIYHAFKKDQTKEQLRSIYISASIHAVMRWDKHRKFKPNDYHDFQHAMAAIGYCDVFITEGSLHHLVTRPQINLSSINGCQIFSDSEAAVAHLRQVW